MKDKTIGIFIPNIHKIGRHEYLDAMCRFAEEYGFNTMCFSSYTDFYNRDDFDKGEKSVYALANNANLIAIVLFAELIKDDDLNREIVELGKKRGIPVFTIDKEWEDAYFICYNNESAFEKLTDHVIEKHGARNICMMSGLKGIEFTEARNEAFRRSIEKHGIPFDESNIYYGDYWENPTRDATMKLLREHEVLPDAIVCANDIMAITVCNVLADNGIYVPSDIIVTGFDGIDRATQNYPTITTAKFDYVTSSKFIIDEIKKITDGAPINPHKCLFDLEIQFGQSCGCVDLLQCTTGKVTSQLYELMTGRQEFRMHMDNMTLSYNDAKDIKECFAELGRFITTVVYRSMAIYLQPSYFGINVSTPDSMVLAAYVIHDTSEYHYPFSEFDMSRLYSEEIFKDSSSLLFVPLHCQDRVYGYVVADYSYLNLAAGERLFDFIVHMNMLLLNIENAAKLKKTLNVLNDMYIRDPLTNLLNRRGFYRDVDSVILKAKSVESDIMIVSVDLDGLKYINDTFGHSEGDYAIRAIADVLKEVTADHGICARFGGDEYLAAIVGNTDENDFKARFLKKITELNENSNKQYPIMASIGIVIITAESALTSLQEAIKNADDKMFAHKKKSKYSRESMEK